MFNNPRPINLVDLLTVHILDKTMENIMDLRCGYLNLVLREPILSLAHPFSPPYDMFFCIARVE